MKNFTLELVVFISGAVVMIYELAGSRILAPYLGTSLTVWTSLIGIILGSLSLGYFFGGKLADNKPRKNILMIILLIASVLIVFTAITKLFVLNIIYSYVQDIRVGGVLATIILFAPASVLLGMVTPYTVKLKLEDIKKSGGVVGSLYAISTIGSIAGTFTAGFFLVPYFGSTKILYILTVLLIFAAFSLRPWQLLKFKKTNIVMLAFFIICYSYNIVEADLLTSKYTDIETLYNSVRLYETIDPRTKRPVRGLTTDPHGTQGAMFLDDDNDLVFDYLKYYRLAEHFNKEFNEALFIGGGVYAFPKDFVKRNDTAVIDVVELDPGITAIAEEYFNLRNSERINIFHEDGRTFLNKNKKKYDVIYLDAFNAHISIPFQLTTKEAIEKVFESLNDNGIVMINIISSVNGDTGKFLRAEIATYKEVFPQVQIFPIIKNTTGDEVGNIMLIAFKNNIEPDLNSESEELQEYLSHIWNQEIILDLPVLTDDYAPVDFYTMNLVK